MGDIIRAWVMPVETEATVSGMGSIKEQLVPNSLCQNPLIFTLKQFAYSKYIFCAVGICQKEGMTVSVRGVGPQDNNILSSHG